MLISVDTRVRWESTVSILRCIMRQDTNTVNTIKSVKNNRKSHTTFYFIGSVSYRQVNYCCLEHSIYHSSSIPVKLYGK